MKGLTVAALLTQGLAVGTFFAFSTFVMAALDRLGPGEAVRAMRSINATILGSPFMAVFLVSVILAVALPLVDGLSDGRWNPLLIGSGVVYLIGTFGMTLLRNVPLNDALARATSLDAETWRAYASAWTFWNHVRTLAGIVSIAGGAWSLREGG